MSTVLKDAPGTFVPDMPVGKLFRTPDNPRKFLDDDAKDAKLVELAKSIEVDGVVEPIIARPHPNGKADTYEIRAGERRLRAAKMAKRKTVPVLVRELDDRAAMRITLIENMERENLHWSEEATGIETALSKGLTYDEIASDTGRALSVVKRRARLTHLAEPWRRASMDETSAMHRWPVKFFEIIARYPEATQIALYKTLWDSGRGDEEYLFSLRLADLRRELGNFLHAIDLAPWKPDDATLVPKAGACAGCVKRSDCAAQMDLFDDDDFSTDEKKSKGKPGARCLDATCWNEKLQAHLRAQEAALRQEHGKVTILAHNSYALDKSSPFKKRAKDTYEVHLGKKSAEGATPALMVDGPRAGETVWIVPEKSAGAASSKKSPGTPSAPAKMPLKERRAQLELQRSRIVVSEVAKRITKIADALDDIINSTSNSKAPAKASIELYGVHVETNVTEDSMAAFAAVFGTLEPHPIFPPKFLTGKKGGATDWEILEHIESKGFDIAMFLFTNALTVLVDDLETSVRESQYRKKLDREHARRACCFLQIDFDAIVEQAEKDKPEPKSWALEGKGKTKSKQNGKAKASGNGVEKKNAARGKGKSKAAAEPEGPTSSLYGNVDPRAPSGNGSNGKAKEVRGTCSACGCTEDNPCVDLNSGEACAWANKKKTCCTFCTDEGSGRDIERPKDRENAVATP